MELGILFVHRVPLHVFGLVVRTVALLEPLCASRHLLAHIFGYLEQGLREGESSARLDDGFRQDRPQNAADATLGIHVLGLLVRFFGVLTDSALLAQLRRIR